MGGLLRKTTVSGSDVSLKRSTENGDLVRTAKKNRTIATRDISTCSQAGSVLFTMGFAHAHISFHERHLYRADPRAMRRKRCVEGHDHASKWHNEKQRGTVLSSEATSLVSCHMTYNPPRPIALSHRIMYRPCRAAMAPWLFRNPKYLKRTLKFSPCLL